MNPPSATTREQLAIAIGQKLMVDIRYYSEDSQADLSNKLVGYQSADNGLEFRQDVTELPQAISQALTDLNLGGVILFSENCHNAQQIAKLTAQIQKASLANSAKLPSFISIDQEGGRVTRLPKATWPAFSGNMAIGATNKQAEFYATQVGKAIGEQLSSLGINVNHAPTVDVNVNHQNPVINVRAFGDSPNHVSELGIAMASGMSANDVIATYKHFPGHGDTHTDSHTGLPLVAHDIDTVNNVDLLPFKNAIDSGACSMIMTAHIQYPALDSSTLIKTDGTEMIRPATLSFEIIQKLLREQLGFEGVVITDALDMASISDFLSPKQAVLETFKAGVDIALMPFKLHTPLGVKAFYTLVNELVDEAMDDEMLKKTVMASFNRIKKVKAKLKPKHCQPDLLQQRKLERKLAFDSLVSLSQLSIPNTKHVSLNIVMPELGQALALSTAIKTLNQESEQAITCLSLQDIDHVNLKEQSLTIVGVEDKKSLVSLGGMDDLVSEPVGDNLKNHTALRLLQLAKEQTQGSVFVSLKAPYNCEAFIGAASYAIASFDANCHQDKYGDWHGAAFEAIAKVLCQDKAPTGTLPIDI
ncbi:MAG: glycoside hydrolase family 3 N-terminal domain-containing protein [Psychrobium sp.]